MAARVLIYIYCFLQKMTMLLYSHLSFGSLSFSARPVSSRAAIYHPPSSKGREVTERREQNSAELEGGRFCAGKGEVKLKLKGKKGGRDGNWRQKILSGQKLIIGVGSKVARATNVLILHVKGIYT